MYTVVSMHSGVSLRAYSCSTDDAQVRRWWWRLRSSGGLADRDGLSRDGQRSRACRARCVGRDAERDRADARSAGAGGDGDPGHVVVAVQEQDVPEVTLRVRLVASASTSKLTGVRVAEQPVAP